MPRKRSKEPRVELGSYKRVSNSAFRYIQDAQKTRHFDTDTLQRAHAIAQYFNKDGSLSKRATRTNAQREEFNQLIAEAKIDSPFQKTKEQTKLERERKKKEARKQIPEEFINKAGSKGGAWTAFEVFHENVFDGLLDTSSYYNIVLETVNDEGTTAEDIVGIFERIRERWDLNTPPESREHVESDARFSFLNDLLAQVDELSKDPNRTNSQLEKIIAKAMKRYRQQTSVQEARASLARKVNVKQRKRLRAKRGNRK